MAVSQMGWVIVWIDEWMDGWVDGWMDGWVGGWMDGWVEKVAGAVFISRDASKGGQVRQLFRSNDFFRVEDLNSIILVGN